MTQRTRDNLQWLGIGLTAIGVLVAVLWPKPHVTVQTIDPQPVLITAADGNAYATGRVADPDAAETFRSRQAFRWFGDTPAGHAKLAPGDKTVILPNAAMKVLGHFLPARDQGQVGDCVGFGTTTAIEYLMLIQIAGGAALDYVDLSQEVIYAGSRVQIGNGKIRGDGSVGAWAAQWVQQDGVVSRGVHGKYDLSTYSQSIARSWGKSGVPADLVTLAKLSPVKGITGVASAAEAKIALAQGYPIAVCSDQGFSTKRDKNGFLKPSGSWGHCMACLGYTDTPVAGFLICNSWGPAWVKGPVGPFPIPDGCFWCPTATFDRMCKEKDTWAFSDAIGFPQRNTDPFFLLANPARRDVAASVPLPVKGGDPCLSLAW